MDNINTIHLVLGIYLLILFAMGIVFSRFNQNVSDYIRSGGQGTWWLVGSSILMSGISAFTFTGNASAAFEAGPSPLVLYISNVSAFLIGFFWIAAWLRQTRAYTTLDVIRMRYGTKTEQFYVYAGLLTTGPFGASVQLLALSVFASSALGFNLNYTIVVTGIIVVFYSTTGGKWAVMATDFVQSLILFSITILVAGLALYKVGGIDGFLSHLSDPDIARDFTFFKEPGAFPDNKFTFKWAAAAFMISLYNQIGLNIAGRYLAVKDGREARLCSLFAGCMMVFGMLIWFIPPMVARFLYAPEILAQNISNPTDASYVYIARELLPNGLMGIMVAAMFAATMSSMDSGLNDQSGKIVRNLVPALRRRLGLAPIREETGLLLCKVITLVLGILIICLSLALASQGKVRLFDLMLTFGSIIGIPMGFPLVVGLYVKRLPPWGFIFIFLMCLLPSLYSFIDAQFFDNPWTYQHRTLCCIASGFIATFICIPFYKRSRESYKQQVDAFFKLMHTPIDPDKEPVSENSNSVRQMVFMSNIVFILGGLVLLLLFLPNGIWGRLGILFVSAFILASGLALRFGVWKERKRLKLNQSHS